MAERKAYVVYGSEDGIIAVCTSKGKAVDKGMAYASQDGARKLPGTRDYYVSKLGASTGCVWIESVGNRCFGTAEITMHALD